MRLRDEIQLQEQRLAEMRNDVSKTYIDNEELRRKIFSLEASNQQQRQEYTYSCEACHSLNDMIDFEQRNREMLLDRITTLERQRVVLLDNNNRYDAIEDQLQQQIKD